LSALHLLVDKLLPLTSTDLEALEDEPEEWLIREGQDEEAWQFEFRVRYLSKLVCVGSADISAMRRKSANGVEQLYSKFPTRAESHGTGNHQIIP
jgi:hypothetical protein